jgi:anti-sigma factor RsiW
MRCSSSETLLDEYVEGTLSPRKAALVAKHVAACPSCARLLEEVRVIDALLIAPRRIELAANFTYKAMAEIRTLPPPRAHRSRPFVLLGSYLAFAWLAIGTYFIVGGESAHAALAVALGSLNGYLDSAVVLAHAPARLLGPNAGPVTEAASAIVVADALFAGLIFAAFAFHRSRRAARNSREAC